MTTISAVSSIPMPNVYPFDNVPNEIVWQVFKNIIEPPTEEFPARDQVRTLCRLANVSKKFEYFSTDNCIWLPLLRDRYSEIIQVGFDKDQALEHLKKEDQSCLAEVARIVLKDNQAEQEINCFINLVWEKLIKSNHSINTIAKTIFRELPLARNIDYFRCYDYFYLKNEYLCSNSFAELGKAAADGNALAALVIFDDPDAGLLLSSEEIMITAAYLEPVAETVLQNFERFSASIDTEDGENIKLLALWHPSVIKIIMNDHALSEQLSAAALEEISLSNREAAKAILSCQDNEGKLTAEQLAAIAAKYLEAAAAKQAWSRTALHQALAAESKKVAIKCRMDRAAVLRFG